MQHQYYQSMYHPILQLLPTRTLKTRAAAAINPSTGHPDDTNAGGMLRCDDNATTMPPRADLQH